MRKFLMLSASAVALSLAALSPASAGTTKCIWNQSVAEQLEVCPQARVTSVTGCAVTGREANAVGACFRDPDPDVEEEDEAPSNGDNGDDEYDNGKHAV